MPASVCFVSSFSSLDTLFNTKCNTLLFFRFHSIVHLVLGLFLFIFCFFFSVFFPLTSLALPLSLSLAHFWVRFVVLLLLLFFFVRIANKIYSHGRNVCVMHMCCWQRFIRKRIVSRKPFRTFVRVERAFCYHFLSYSARSHSLSIYFVPSSSFGIHTHIFYQC